MASIGKIWFGRRLRWPDRLSVSDEMRVRVASTALWVLVVLAAAGGVSSWFRADTRPASPAAVAQAEQVSPSWSAAGFGERFVATYLSAGPETAASLAAFLGYTPNLPATRAPNDGPSGVAVVDVESLAKDYWAVTVAATVAGREEFWRVGVVRRHGGLVTSGLPSPVAVPSVSESAELAVPLSEVPPADDPMVQAVTGFVGAYVCGDGELSRYLAPGVALEPVRSAGCVAVRLDRWGSRPDGSERQVVVTEAVVDSGSRARRVSFALVLGRRDGRWEVAELLPALPLAGATETERRPG